jgi:hypothetical protein
MWGWFVEKRCVEVHLGNNLGDKKRLIHKWVLLINPPDRPYDK